MALFEEFSAGYCVGQLYIESIDGEHAVMEQTRGGQRAGLHYR